MIYKHPTNIPGLKYLPSFNSNLDSQDWVQSYEHYLLTLELSKITVDDGHTTFSTPNQKVLMDLCERLKTQGPFNIMEIGVARDQPSSTDILTKYADNYFGVDLRDVSFLHSRPNVKTICTSSYNQEGVRNMIGNTPIHLLFLDGDHSINTLANDWLYQDLVVDEGYIVMHDTNRHSGPHTFFEAINEWDYLKQRYCLCDYGIGVVKKTKSPI